MGAALLGKSSEHDLASHWYTPLFQDARKPLAIKRVRSSYAPDTPQGVHVLLKGLIKTYFIDNAGNEHIHLFIAPHELFPLPWATQGEHLNIYYEAVSDIEVKRVARETITSLAVLDAKIAYIDPTQVLAPGVSRRRANHPVDRMGILVRCKK